MRYFSSKPILSSALRHWTLFYSNLLTRVFGAWREYQAGRVERRAERAGRERLRDVVRAVLDDYDPLSSDDAEEETSSSEDVATSHKYSLQTSDLHRFFYKPITFPEKLKFDEGLINPLVSEDKSTSEKTLVDSALSDTPLLECTHTNETFYDAGCERHTPWTKLQLQPFKGETAKCDMFDSTYPGC